MVKGKKERRRLLSVAAAATAPIAEAHANLGLGIAPPDLGFTVTERENSAVHEDAV